MRAYPRSFAVPPLDMAHKANEWVDVEQLQTAALVYEDIARQWFDGEEQLKKLIGPRPEVHPWQHK